MKNTDTLSCSNLIFKKYFLFNKLFFKKQQDFTITSDGSEERVLGLPLTGSLNLGKLFSYSETPFPYTELSSQNIEVVPLLKLRALYMHSANTCHSGGLVGIR